MHASGIILPPRRLRSQLTGAALVWWLLVAQISAMAGPPMASFPTPTNHSPSKAAQEVGVSEPTATRDQRVPINISRDRRQKQQPYSLTGGWYHPSADGPQLGIVGEEISHPWGSLNVVRPIAHVQWTRCRLNELLAIGQLSDETTLYRVTQLSRELNEERGHIELTPVAIVEVPEAYRVGPHSLILPWQGEKAYLWIGDNRMNLVDPLAPAGVVPAQVCVNVDTSKGRNGTPPIPGVKAAVTGKVWIKPGDRLVTSSGVLHVVRFAIPDPKRHIAGWVEFRWSRHEPADLVKPPAPKSSTDATESKTPPSQP